MHLFIKKLQKIKIILKLNVHKGEGNICYLNTFTVEKHKIYKVFVINFTEKNCCTLLDFAQIAY